MNLPENLTYISDDTAGYTRKKWGRGYVYYKEGGEKVKDRSQLERIKKLVIPPNWSDVWICEQPEGHLQCTGRDEKGRKQYIYHKDWVAYQQSQKFSKMKVFGLMLPKIRENYESALQLKEWPKSKVVALVISLLDKYYFRIGNDYYAKQNETFGLTTLRRKHLDEVSGDHITFSFRAKSGKYREVEVNDAELAQLIKDVSELRGYEIFKYKIGYRKYESVDSSDVNSYLRSVTSENFTAKDFRTWGATKLAVEFYSNALKQVRENKRKTFEPTLVGLVAEKMGNTRAVCRDYYIHPKVLRWVVECFESGHETINYSIEDNVGLEPTEKLILELI